MGGVQRNNLNTSQWDLHLLVKEYLFVVVSFSCILLLESSICEFTHKQTCICLNSVVILSLVLLYCKS